MRDHLRKLGRQPGGEGGTEAQLRLASLPDLDSPESDESGSSARTQALLRAAVELIRGEFEVRHLAGILADGSRGATRPPRSPSSWE